MECHLDFSQVVNGTIISCFSSNYPQDLGLVNSIHPTNDKHLPIYILALDFEGKRIRWVYASVRVKAPETEKNLQIDIMGILMSEIYHNWDSNFKGIGKLGYLKDSHIHVANSSIVNVVESLIVADCIACYHHSD